MICSRNKGGEHEVRNFAEDKPAEKVFEYKLEVANNVLPFPQPCSQERLL